jgi:ferritin-like metal-binding protein YciE
MPGTKTRKAPAKKSNGASTKSNGTTATQESALEKFLHDQLKDLYWAEKHLTKALPKMQKAATSEELQQAIDDHTAETEEHVSRLEQVFELIGKKPQAKKCDGMEGLIKEGETAIEETEDGSATRDAAIICSAQKVEHYEISAYGTLVQLATTIGNSEAAELLQTTLDEEKQTDEYLTQLAESSINWEAGGEEEDE